MRNKELVESFANNDADAFYKIKITTNMALLKTTTSLPPPTKKKNVKNVSV